MSRTTLQHFDALPAEVEPIRGDRDAGVKIRQGSHTVEVTSDDPAWLEEVEGAFRAAREQLESRTRLAVS